jgi:hypothetical protein
MSTERVQEKGEESFGGNSREQQLPVEGGNTIIEMKRDRG